MLPEPHKHDDSQHVSHAHKHTYRPVCDGEGDVAAVGVDGNGERHEAGPGELGGVAE